MTFNGDNRIGTWRSNGRLAIYAFIFMLILWAGFNIWAIIGGFKPPSGLDPLLPATLGFAITVNSVERRNKDDAIDTRVQQLEDKNTLDDEERPAPKVKPQPVKDAKKVVRHKRQENEDE